MRKILVAIATAAALALAGTAAADSGVTLSGGATVSNGVVTLTSNTSGTPASAITFALPSGTTFADLKTLSADYDITAGGCGGGSPRFSITMADGNNVFVYLGPGPNYDTCPLNVWQSTGNFIGNSATNWDLTKEGGAFYSTYANALALLGSKQVTSVSFVVDGGWKVPGNVQTVLARHVTLATATGTEHSPGSPGQACKAEQKADPDGFRANYGTNHDKANAFGKCVSERAKAKHHHHHHHHH